MKAPRYQDRASDVFPYSRKFVIVFTNGNAISLLAESKAEARGSAEGSPDQFGEPRKVRSIREVNQ